MPPSLDALLLDYSIWLYVTGRDKFQRAIEATHKKHKPPRKR